MGLFKKKKAEPAPAASETQQEQRQEIKSFAAQFLPEEIDLLAVTAPSSVSHTPIGDTGLWAIVAGLTAWMDEHVGEVIQGQARLEAVVDDALLEHILMRTPGNFIISVVARPHEDGHRFMMTDLPKPGFDADLKAILDAQKAPVTLEAEGLGTFTLNRSLGWYERAVDWMDTEISLTFDQAEEFLPAAQDTARTLLNDQSVWHERVCAYAADTLLDRANELLGEEEEPLTRDDFLAQLDVESLLTGPDGAFEFWFSGDDLFLAHPVHVTGTLEQGPTQAEIED